jgi:hypothetical protein
MIRRKGENLSAELQLERIDFLGAEVLHIEPGTVRR